jgi:GNAT superfamily N-acetyltransferase
MNGIDMLDKNALVHEVEANLWETWSNFGRGPGCCLHDEGDILWFETPIPIIPYNAILKFQVEDDIEQQIDRLVDHFNNRQVALMWLVHPSSRPADLPDRLERQGLQEIELVPGMVRGLDDLPEPPPLPRDIEVRKVVEQEDAGEFFQFAAWRWGVPDEYKGQMGNVMADFRFGEPGAKAHMWQAWRDGRPVAKAGINLASGSAGIYAVVTRPEARRLGLARILTLAALEFARARGYKLAVLHSTPMAEGLYRSLGFETVAAFRVFASEEAHI